MGLRPTEEMKVLVILSEAKNLQFLSAPSQCRFFASLRMTDFRGSVAKNCCSCTFPHEQLPRCFLTLSMTAFSIYTFMGKNQSRTL